jgi:peptide/nickel transport system substrate-binding protein
MSINLRRFSLVLMLLLVMVSVTVGVSAQDDVAREDTVIIDIDSQDPIPNPENFNWLVPGTYRNQGAHQLMWEPLFILNYETGEIQPWLGESFTPNEGQDVWTLKIRDGVKWSDGVPYTADDVVFTFQLLLDDETVTLNEAANTQQWVESVEKIDDLTVQFNLKAPNPRFQLDYFSVRIWGNNNILPKHVFEGKDPFTFTNYDPEQGWPLGTGPYKLVSASPTNFVWDRDDNWWGAATGFHALPEPLRVVFAITGSEENKALLMSDGQLDSSMNITLGAFEAIQARNPNVIAWFNELPYAWADPCPRELSFNTEAGVFSDPALRKAVSLIVDRNQIIEVAYEGTTTASKTLFVQYGGMQPYIDAVVAAGMGASPDADVAGAQALIEGAGWAKNGDGIYEKDGQVLSAPIEVNQNSIEYVRTTNVLVEQLRAAGIDATANPLTQNTANDNRAFGNFSIAYNWDNCGSVNEPWNSMNQINTNFYVPIGERASAGESRWNTDGAKAYSEIVDKIGTLPLGDPQIVDLVVQAYRYVYDETIVIPLVQASKLVPFDTTYWTGWPTAENNFNHPATWWNSTHQIILNLHKAGM